MVFIMLSDYMWEQFIQSGSVADYLVVKELEYEYDAPEPATGRLAVVTI